jgi:small subunit ribosomal protein S19
MPRSIWKGSFLNLTLVKQLEKQIKNKKQKKSKIKVKTHSRASTITPDLLNRMIYIHNGIKYISVKINIDMIGHKLGEFAPTRARYHFKRKSKNK